MFFWEEDLPQLFSDFAEQMIVIDGDSQLSVPVLFDIPTDDAALGKGQLHGALTAPSVSVMATDVERLSIEEGKKVSLRGYEYRIVAPILPSGDGLVRMHLCEETGAASVAAWR